MNSSIIETPQELCRREAQNPSAKDKGVDLEVDMLQTQLLYLEEQNKNMTKKLDELIKEKKSESDLFQKKVQQLQEKFLVIEKQVKEKDLTVNTTNPRCEISSLTKINRLKQENDLLGRELYRKSQELHELQLSVQPEIIESETIYESINLDKETSFCQDCSSCFQCSIVIICILAIVIALVFVLPLKILFDSQ